MASVCRSCGASILWGETVNGKAMPLDAAPCADGLFVLLAGLIRPILPDDAPDSRRYNSHFASCPNAKQHRKAR